MAIAKQHIIHKFSLELDADSSVDADALKNVGAGFLKEKILQTIETVFDEIAGDELIRIDKIDIDLGHVDVRNMEAEIIRQIQQQLPIQIQNTINSGEARKINPTDGQIFEYFLKNGTLPWWNDRISINDLEKKLVESFKNKEKSFVEIFQKLSLEELERLVFQFSDDFFLGILNTKTSSKKWMGSLEELKEILSSIYSPRLVRHQFWRSIIKAIFINQLPEKAVEKYVFTDVIKQLTRQSTYSEKYVVEHIFKKAPIQNKQHRILKWIDKNGRFLEKEVVSEKLILKEKMASDLSVSTTKDYYINNAGFIILHPFITYLFEHLEYTKQNKFVDNFQQQQAALLLQYLVNEATESEEIDLLLNKILCGIDITEPIENTLILNNEMEVQTNNLLESTVKHWSVLKNTSPAGLRETFLLREGKLSRKENGDWKLFIPQNTVDILISKLPWSISMIKLPWMKNMLWVEWA